MKFDKPLRMCSWWLCWEDLSWPREPLKDKIRYRADRFKVNHIDTAVIFGAHFRWDFMPLWSVLHDELHFIAEELHQRDIALIDHHSAVLTHRYRNMEDRQRMTLYTPHHIPFCPDRVSAASWCFRGKLLNDWRMIRVDNHEPVFLPHYTAEEFCINHPHFRESYMEYVKMLFRETAIDGLMCDDAFFYPRFYACACPYCLEKFGGDLPPAEDLDFWGNWENPHFREWIRMRYRSVAQFNHCVKSVLPEGAFLSNCCSQSVCSAANELGLDYTLFAEDSTHVEMEICGSIPRMEPDTAGQGLFPLLSDLLYHLAIAENAGLDNFALGYAFTPEAAQFVWALNKFMGSGTWISCARHALRIPEEEQELLEKDYELPGFCYGVEERFCEYFSTEHCPDAVVLFSRETRDNYGGYMCDYADDYHCVCRSLIEQGYDCGTVVDIPDPAESSARILVLASTVILTSVQRKKIFQWLDAGKEIVASGPVGFWDESLTAPCPLIPEMNFSHPEGRKEFPHDTWGSPREPVRCGNAPGWKEVFPRFYWNPCRMQDSPEWYMPQGIPRNAVPGWAWRKYKGRPGEYLEHFFALNYRVEYDRRVEEMRFAPGLNKLIRKITPSGKAAENFPVLPENSCRIFLPLTGEELPEGQMNFRTKGKNVYYVICRCKSR